MTEKPAISLFFPVYNDENTVRIVAEKAIRILEEVSVDYEIIIINDASPDNSGNIANEMASRYTKIKVIHHEKNQGYGAAIITGLKH